MEIYRIYNKKNGKSYIGCTTVNFTFRYPNGKWWKWSTNRLLLTAVSKYGLENFDYEILHISAKTMDELLELEKLYIKQYNSFVPVGYNLTKGGGSLYPTIEREYELIDYNGTVYKIKNLCEFCKKAKLSYDAMLNMVCGLNKSSQGFTLSSNPIEFIPNNINQIWELQNISTNEIFKIKRCDVNEFANKIGIKKQYIWMLINKKVKVTHGFKLVETIIDGKTIRKSVKKFHNYKFLNPSGELITIDNIYKYCQNKSLSRGGFYALISGKHLTYKGWRLPYSVDELKTQQELRRGKTIKIKCIHTGEILEIKNISKFCRDMSLNLNSFNCMVRGSIKQYNGYALEHTDLSKYKFPKKISYVSLVSDTGDVIEGKNPKDIEKTHKIMTAQSILSMIRKEYESIKGWKILTVKYMNGYYPNIVGK